MYDAFELCISLIAETYKKPGIFALRRFYTDATVDPPPARDWRRAVAVSLQGGLSERDKLGRRRSIELMIIPPSSDARPL